MKHVIHFCPHFPAGQRGFVRGLKNVGAMVTGIGDARPEHIDSEVRSLLNGYEYVPYIGDEDAILAAVQRIQARGPWVHAFEATIESHMNIVARVRERAKIPGLPYEVVNRCRDKLVMKEFLSERGIPCATTKEVSTGDDARAFAKEVGYPLILKPRDGAGAHGTHKLLSNRDLEVAIDEEGLDQGGRFFMLEEFIEGHEGFFDTITVGGEVVFEAISHYFPNVLEAMRTRDVNPYIVTTNRLDEEGYAELRKFGRVVIKDLEIDFAPTHMEWFFGPKGLKFSEIGARPPGVNFWDIYCAATGVDIYTEWARARVWGDTHFGDRPRKAGGLVSIRPNRDGTIVGYTGIDEMQAKYGGHIFRAHLPPPGTRTAPVEGGYLANAYIYATHPDYDTLRGMLQEIGATVQCWAE